MMPDLFFTDYNSTFIEKHKPIVDLLNSINRESDRGSALIIASILDDTLSKFLSSFFIANDGTKHLMNGFNAPFSNFSSKIYACFGLGLINEDEYRELHIIRKIRNEFAHRFNVDFNDQTISKYCNSLKYGVRKIDKNATTVIQFKTSSVALVAQLIGREELILEKRLKVI